MLGIRLMETVATPLINISDLSALNHSLCISALPNLTQVIPIHNDELNKQFGLNSEDSCAYYNDMISFKQLPSAELESIFYEYTDVIQQ